MSKAASKKLFAVISILVIAVLMVGSLVACNDKKTEESVKVTFKNGDTVVKEATVEKGGSVAASDIPADPQKSGYTFDGWYDGSTKFVSSATFDADTTFVAKFTENAPAPFEGTFVFTPMYGDKVTFVFADGKVTAGDEEGTCTLSDGKVTIEGIEGFDYTYTVLKKKYDGNVLYCEVEGYELALVAKDYTIEYDISGFDGIWGLLDPDNGNDYLVVVINDDKVTVNDIDAVVSWDGSKIYYGLGLMSYISAGEKEDTVTVNGEEVYTKTDTIEWVVKFVDNNGKPMGKKSVVNGQKVGDVPTDINTDKKGLSFKGWVDEAGAAFDKDTEINGNAIYTAKYELTSFGGTFVYTGKYGDEVTFVFADGKVTAGSKEGTYTISETNVTIAGIEGFDYTYAVLEKYDNGVLYCDVEGTELALVKDDCEIKYNLVGFAGTWGYKDDDLGWVYLTVAINEGKVSVNDIPAVVNWDGSKIYFGVGLMSYISAGDGENTVVVNGDETYEKTETKKWIVKFLDNNNKVVATKEVVDGQAIGEIDIDTDKAGYTFEGWVDENGAAFDKTTKITANTYYTANYKFNAFTGAFVYSDPTQVEPVVLGFTADGKVVRATLVDEKPVVKEGTYTIQGTTVVVAGIEGFEYEYSVSEAHSNNVLFYEGQGFEIVLVKFGYEVTYDISGFEGTWVLEDKDIGNDYLTVVISEGKVTVNGSDATVSWDGSKIYYGPGLRSYISEGNGVDTVTVNGDLTYVKAESIVWMVSFVSGGQVIESKNIADGQAVGAIDEITNKVTSEKFAGWFDAEGNQFSATAEVKSNIVFTAKFIGDEKGTYTGTLGNIALDGLGKATLSDKDYEYYIDGNEVYVSTYTVRLNEGNTYTVKSDIFGTFYYTATDIVTIDGYGKITITSGISGAETYDYTIEGSVISYQISEDLGGSYTVVANGQVLLDQNSGEGAEYHKAGFVVANVDYDAFNGWWKAQGEWATYYLQIDASNMGVTVRYDDGSGYFENMENARFSYDEKSLKFGIGYKVEIVEGKLFMEALGLNFESCDPQNITWTVMFSGGDDYSKYVNVKDGETPDVSTITDPEKPGYKFINWLDEYKNEYTIEEISALVITKGMRFTANFEQEKIVVTFIVNGDKVGYELIADLENGGSLAQAKIDSHNPASTALEEGYYFVGWYTENGEKITDKTVFTEDTNAVAAVNDKWSYYGVFADVGEGIMFVGELEQDAYTIAGVALTFNEGKLTSENWTVIKAGENLVVTNSYYDDTEEEFVTENYVLKGYYTAPYLSGKFVLNRNTYFVIEANGTVSSVDGSKPVFGLLYREDYGMPTKLIYQKSAYSPFVMVEVQIEGENDVYLVIDNQGSDNDGIYVKADYVKAYYLGSGNGYIYEYGIGENTVYIYSNEGDSEFVQVDKALEKDAEVTVTLGEEDIMLIKVTAEATANDSPDGQATIADETRGTYTYGGDTNEIKDYVAVVDGFGGIKIYADKDAENPEMDLLMMATSKGNYVLYDFGGEGLQYEYTVSVTGTTFDFINVENFEYGVYNLDSDANYSAILSEDGCALLFYKGNCIDEGTFTVDVQKGTVTVSECNYYINGTFTLEEGKVLVGEKFVWVLSGNEIEKLVEAFAGSYECETDSTKTIEITVSEGKATVKVDGTEVTVSQNYNGSVLSFTAKDADSTVSGAQTNDVVFTMVMNEGKLVVTHQCATGFDDDGYVETTAKSVSYAPKTSTGSTGNNESEEEVTIVGTWTNGNITFTFTETTVSCSAAYNDLDPLQDKGNGSYYAYMDDMDNVFFQLNADNTLMVTGDSSYNGVYTKNK